MVHIIEPGGRPFTHALAVVAMTRALREPRDQRRPDKALRIDHGLMRLLAHRGFERADLAPSRRVEQRTTPPAGRDRHHAGDIAMKPHQRRERLLDDPADACARPVPPGIADRWHVMDHVTERGRLDEQNVGHETWLRTNERS